MPGMIRTLEISGMLGCKQAIVHPIHHQEYIGHEEEQFELNMKFYRDLLPYAKEFGVKIALENMWQNEAKRKHPGVDVCSLATEFVRYMDTLNDDYFTACLDLGHSGMVGEEAQDAIRILVHDRLGALHVHDNNYREDQHTLPYLGKMNFEAICKALAEVDYKGEFTYEAARFYSGIPNELLPSALKFMVEVGRHLIGRIEYYKNI
jgi:sugar phosphate isomerase/epimerase